ncbi:aminotransferase class I/II-fold pyridoxal phosphate-dependent enzyme [Halobacteriovorax marinus]|uniref:aminotransferase class I/II-fold pyridoxal phosphate-dependent enzyme n=1 Tax=Halobacteriovorax marinus TaxID=97084 RepID=UPI003A8D552E
MHNHPMVVEIEINSGCNLACSYCPNSIEGYATSFEMEKSLFTMLMKQLEEKGYRGKLAFDFYNEPMIAKDFDWYIEEASRILPRSFISLYTNGTKITSAKRLIELVEKGIGEFVITKHEQVGKLPIESFYNELTARLKSKVTLKGFEDLNLTNRGGSLEIKGDVDARNLPCSVPRLMLTITYDGNVLSCFEDAYRREVLGNIKDQNIIEIWNNEKSCRFINDLANGERQKYEICKNCNRVDSSEGNLKMDKHFINNEEIEELSNLLLSGDIFRYQKTDGLCRKFEKRFADKIGVKYAHLVTSGTNALVCSLIAAGVGQGDEVLIPSYTFVATASAVLIAGAIPVVCEVDKNLQIDLSHANSQLSKATKAIIPVHMDGFSCDMNAVMKFSKENDLVVIEDSCQSLGGEFEGKFLGSIGDFGCFSFNKDKILTSGDGGIVVTNSREMYERICCISDGAFSFSPHHQDFFKEITPFLGYSMRVSEITGAMLNIQLNKLDMILMRYRERKKIIQNTLEEISFISSPYGTDREGDCGINVYISCDDAKKAAELGKALRDKRVPAIPPSLRPGHVVWKWGKILNTKAFSDERRSPYAISSKKYDYSAFNFISSMENVSKTLKIEIDIHWTIDETYRFAELIKDAINQVFENK